LAFEFGAVFSIKDKDFRTQMRNNIKNTSDLKKNLKTATSDMRGFDNQSKKTGNSMASFAKKLAGVAGAYISIKAAVNTVRESIALASKNEEMLSKFGVVFGELTDSVDAWANAQAEAMGRSRHDMKNYLAESQNMLVGMGATREEGAKLSKQIATLGIDLASFNNLADDDAIRNLQSAIMGNHEASKSLGAVLNENTLATAMERMQIKGKFRDLDEVTKMQVRYQAIVDQSTDAMGDAERTSGSYANQMKRFSAIVKDTKIMLGEAFLPTATKVAEKMNEWAKNVQSNMPMIQEKIKTGIGIARDVFEKLGIAINFVRENKEILIPVVAGLVTGITALKVISTISGMMKVLKATTLAQTYATGGLNAVMAANPFGLVAIGIAGLVTAGIALYRNWDTVKEIGLETWEALTGGITSFVEGATEQITKFTDGIKDTWESTKNFLKNPIKGTVELFQDNKTSENVKSSVHGSHYSGLRRVPFDGYVAELHKDERVLTKQEANNYNKSVNTNSSTSNNNFTININATNKSTREIVNELIPELKMALGNI